MVNESLINCPICSSEISSPGYSYQNDLYQGDAERLFSDLRIYFCSQCEIGFAYPFVGAKSLSEFYTSIYRSSSGAHSHQLENYSLADKYGQRAFSQLQLARTFWQKENMPEKILDVGAGHGYLLKVAQILFPTAKLFALEPDRHSLETLKKLGAHVFNLLLNENTVKEISEKFDLVVCSHVIEHYNANELHGFCRALQEILIPGGLAVIEVPWGEIPKYPDMRFNDAPHLSFFSENSLRYIMSKYFDVLFCSSAGPKVESNLIAYSRKNKQVISKKDIRSRDKMKAKIKNVLLESNVPILNKMIAANRKLKQLDFTQILSGDYYTYGPERVFLRTIVRKWK